MELFIRIKDGEPFEHPIMGENFRQAFPGIDVNNLPSGYMRFVSKKPPTPGPYQRNLRSRYVIAGEYCTEEFICDELTAEERLAQQDAIKAEWAAQQNYASWWFDEITCRFMPPIPIPDETQPYVWRESDVSWVLIPKPPMGEGWNFDVEKEQWVKA